jgi:ribonucleoside-diphosphate reductase beta chain
LEGLYFYNGFAFFDTLADQQKMKATDRMINYIRRDELTHVTMFSQIIREIQREFPDIFDAQIVYDMFKVAVDQEIKWSQFILRKANHLSHPMQQSQPEQPVQHSSEGKEHP